ncbi:T9SS type A sorting domain-containing protein [Balneolaceae bacterium YR4-1]|uniref:T9SS type A sorting domain-containing protein n=2 Tax=Halalkalibaculum roseum TaxID=2709311 RepID=A0A6M1SUS8_9BACT|nr:T9SS type A sorting domain-containing protein [Halalkalibaculum roseum]
MLISSMLLLFYSHASIAQEISVSRSHSIQSANTDLESIGAPDSLTIIAIRVAFQPDENRLTSGDGTFREGSLPYLDNENITIDPLPHDQSYFESHLEFAKNYFTKVSANRIEIDYRVLPEIYSLDRQMEYYSPTGENFSNEKLAQLAEDSWAKVEANGGFDTEGLNPDKTAFIIFHAGVGRDIQLTGTTLDITPQDIPSLTLNRNSLSDLLGDPSFSGFPINNGSFQVTNTLILPRTLSRRGEDITGQEFVLQLSINGLLCASLGSYFGLPDLFNTQTGSSGIGRFGLMDGESFFSYRGLFPPYPSAWERIQLGWDDAFTITSTQPSGKVQLSAASENVMNSIARYNLSSEEYFLLENRHRDPENDGATISIRQPDGTLVQQTFSNTNQTITDQEAGFEDLFTPGVLVDIDNLEWSLPGGLDIGADEEAGTADDRFLNGGILIWHIDEAVIRSELDRQRVNADPERRGVDLEEADGAQDIGEAAGSNFSNQGRGWAFDFWWRGNNASVITLQGDTLRLYENRFSIDTRPSNESNSGARSYFEFYDFSENLPTASFRFRPVANEVIQPVSLTEETVPNQSVYIDSNDSYRTHYPSELAIYTAQTDTFLIIPAAGTVYGLHLNSGQAGYFDFQVTNPQQPFITDQLVLANSPYEQAESVTEISSWNWDGNSWQNLWQASADPLRGFLSSQNGDTLLVDFTSDRFMVNDGTAVANFSVPNQSSVRLAGLQSILTPGTLTVNGESFTVPNAGDNGRLYTGAIQTEPGISTFYLLSDQTLSILRNSGEYSLDEIAEATFLEWPALVDFNDDQRMEIIFTDGSGSLLYGKNASGAMLNNFPIQAPQGSRFIGTPLVADLEGDGSQDLLVTVQDSVSMNIYSYNQLGKVKENFPLFVGSIQNPAYQPIHPVINDQTLYAVSHLGELKAWHFPQMQNVLWDSRYGNEPFNKVTGRISGTESPDTPSDILVEEETYNWPNPASQNTNIRYLLRESGRVEIKIISQGGRVIYDESFEAAGGIPEEQRIDTSNWGNGVYFALVTANIDGQQSRKMIKIAVVR